MTHKIVSLRVFKDEYQKSFILFLAKSFKNEQSEKIITLYGITEEVAEAIMSLQYKSEYAIAQVFPQFRTLKNEQDTCKAEIIAAFESMRDAMLRLYNSDAWQGLETAGQLDTLKSMGLDRISDIVTKEFTNFKNK